ncbi:MAG: hypothetical protein ABI583_03330, partial [Betaproteobacteria bacterium]
TGNPVFPYFNNIFQSPLVASTDFADVRFAKRSIETIVKLPFRLLKESAGYVSEVGLRDWRLALAFPAFTYLSWTGSPVTMLQRARWRVLFIFFGTSFVLWAFGSAYYRYIGVLELLAIVAIVATAATVRPKRAVIIVASVTLLVIATTSLPRWGRVAHGEAAVVVSLPSLPENSAVVIATAAPLGYIVPNLPLTVPVVSLVNNFMGQAEPQNKLYLLAKQRIAEHKGPLWLLVDLAARDEKNFMGIDISDKLAEAGVVTDFSACKPFQTPMDATLAFCPLKRAH